MALDPRDFQILAEVKLRSDVETAENSTYLAWIEWERSVRSELAKLRAQKRGVDPTPFVKAAACSQIVLDTVRSAVADYAPEQAESILLLAYWQFLDELEVGHHFDIDKLIVYFLKLQILDLKRMRNKEDGIRMFSAQYEAIRTRQ